MCTCVHVHHLHVHVHLQEAVLEVPGGGPPRKISNILAEWMKGDITCNMLVLVQVNVRMNDILEMLYCIHSSLLMSKSWKWGHLNKWESFWNPWNHVTSLIRTPKFYSLCPAFQPLKSGHLTNQDTSICPKSVFALYCHRDMNHGERESHRDRTRDRNADRDRERDRERDQERRRERSREREKERGRRSRSRDRERRWVPLYILYSILLVAGWSMHVYI